MKNRTIKICLAVVLLFGSGCEKFVDVPVPAGQIPASVVFNDETTANSAVVGIYGQLMSSNLRLLNGAISVYSGLSSDELTYNAATAAIAQFRTNGLLDNNTQLSLMWSDAYTYIYQLNACLEGIAASGKIRTELKASLSGECRFLRALIYFQLSNLFGDVPLVTTTDYATNAAMPRTAIALIDQQIVRDLEDAALTLNENYPATGERIRPIRLAARALLAKVYLYQKDYARAESNASAVLSSAKFSLVQDINAVFLSASPEAILQFMPVLSGPNTSEGAAFVPSSTTTVPPYSLTTGLVGLFTAADKRKGAWTKTNVNAGTTYYYPYKYKVRSSTAYSEYNIVLRLSEQYLIRAEARAQLGNITGSRADLDAVRSRAGLAATTAADKDGLLSAIELERRLELFAEWSNRWLDLKRTGRASDVLSVLKGASWQATDVLYPIPISQIRLNPALVQNPGY